MAIQARKSPTAPPMSVSRRFSMMTRLSSVRRLAPKALRTDISGRRRCIRAATMPLRFRAGTNKSSMMERATYHQRLWLLSTKNTAVSPCHTLE